MSELKTYDFPVDHGDFTTTIELFYLKSEVDAVIEELKIKVKVKTYDIEAARKLNTSYLSDYAEALKRESHHKYKRCLAMAQWCEERYRYLTCLENWQMTDKEYQQAIGDYWDRWYKRWLALAEKFKEAK